VPDAELPIDEATAWQLTDGTHPAPQDLLGTRKFGRATWLTAIDPGAERLEARIGTKSYALDKVAGAVFCGKVPAGRAYRLIGHSGDQVWEYEDAYRFPAMLGDMDLHLIGEGTHLQLWDALGAHVTTIKKVVGTHFAVWAPNARQVSIVGDFNHWDGRRHPMRPRGSSGIWELFVPGAGDGQSYKYQITNYDGHLLPLKADPMGFGAQHPPETASVIRDISGYGWRDSDWLAKRAKTNDRNRPVSIYEVHLGSWKRRWEDGGRPLSYKEAAQELVGYAKDMGFTHLELLPVSEFPFDGSWGYQPVGLYAPTTRFGPPHEFRDLVDAAHRAGLGILLDWVPGHFPSDVHGLAQFDGSHLYEHADPKEGFHQDWNTLIYNYGRTEVANFLIANAVYWLEEYHIDGLRVDAVASMLYRDYSRAEGEWIPNAHGGRENLEAINFLKRMNSAAYAAQAGIMTVAEESTSFPMVSAPVDAGGLGFGFKWNMGWMNDTLDYIQRDPIYRQHHHHQLTFGLHYAFSENFVLPISHDEVVHGKGSMLAKMPGLDWEKFANLRAYYAFMWGHPGKKLLFMGCEFAQPEEWNHSDDLNWDAAARPPHKGVQDLVRDLNRIYATTPALYRKDCEADGFECVEANDAAQSVYAFLRYGDKGDAPVMVLCNFTPVERTGMRFGVPFAGHWEEILNTDAGIYGGGNRGNMGGVDSTHTPAHGKENSIEVTLPPLSVVMFKVAHKGDLGGQGNG